MQPAYALQNKVILHVDMNNFYASVECMLNPDLRDKPVAVCGSVEERHGIVLAKNYKAKAFGVATAEAVWQAKQKCPSLVIVPPHFEQYMKFSHLAREIYGRYTDMIEPFGLDECWLDVTGSRYFGDGEKIAYEIKEAVKSELGLTVSVGVSFNKVFAKLGSDMKKPDAVTVITKQNFKRQIWHLPVAELLGVGRSTNKVLASYGIHTIGELAETSDALLISRLGKNGVSLKRYANGEDTSPVTKSDYVFPMKSAGHGTTTIKDLETNAQVWSVMLELVQDISEKLRNHNKKATGVSVYIRNSELVTQEWQCGIKVPTSSTLCIAKAAYELFKKSYTWQKPIRSVTVRAINLVEKDLPEQLDLFTDVSEVDRKERLDLVVASIRARYGKNAIRNAVLCADLFMTDKAETLPFPRFSH